MATEHNITFQDQPGNMANFRKTASCSCGFQTRQPRPELVVSQVIKHLEYHGVEVPADLKYPPEVEQPPVIGTDDWYKQQADQKKVSGGGLVQDLGMQSGNGSAVDNIPPNPPVTQPNATGIRRFN